MRIASGWRYKGRVREGGKIKNLKKTYPHFERIKAFAAAREMTYLENNPGTAPDFVSFRCSKLEAILKQMTAGGRTLVSSPETYINSSSLLTVRCEQGHEFERVGGRLAIGFVSCKRCTELTRKGNAQLPGELENLQIRLMGLKK